MICLLQFHFYAFHSFWIYHLGLLEYLKHLKVSILQFVNTKGHSKSIQLAYVDVQRRAETMMIQEE